MSINPICENLRNLWISFSTVSIDPEAPRQTDSSDRRSSAVMGFCAEEEKDHPQISQIYTDYFT